MKIRPSIRLLTIGALISTNLFASSDAEITYSEITDEGGLTLEYNFTSVGNGSTCIALVRMDIIRDSIGFTAPETEPGISVPDLVWNDSIYHTSLPSYDESLEGLPRKGENKEKIENDGNGIAYHCRQLDIGTSSEAGEDDFGGLVSRRNKGYLQSNPIHTINLTPHLMSTYSAEYVNNEPAFTHLEDPSGMDFTTFDSDGNYVVLDDSLVITTAIFRRNNGKTQEFKYFQSWIDLKTGEINNLPIGLDTEAWHYPGYGTNYANPLPALITFNDQNQPGCLAQLNSSNQYECLWPEDGDIQDAFPSSIGDISNTDDFRVLSCGEAEEDGIESPSGIYDVVSLETQDGVTGYHTPSHWCLRVDKTYRSWHNLLSTTGQGWVVAKDGMGNWWCIRDEDRICKNSLIEDVTIPEDQNLAAKMSVLASPMADTSLTSCRFNDNYISACSANDNSAFDSSVTLDSLKQAFFIDAANLLESERPTQ